MRNASPDGKFLNFADALRVVPGSTYTRQPVWAVICSSNWDKPSELTSAFTRSVVLFQTIEFVSAACTLKQKTARNRKYPK